MGEYLYAQVGEIALLIEATVEGVFLHTYRPDGLVGDTWHPSLEEAKAQAAHDMNKLVGPWRPVSPAFKLELAAQAASHE